MISLTANSLEMFLLFLTKFSLVFNILNGPPVDYASLVSTQSALKLCQLEYKSEVLMAYLKVGMNEISEGELKNAFEKLGSSKAAERKAAALILVNAGLKSMSYLKKGLSSSDPEIKDASRALRLEIEKDALKNNAENFVKKFYAIRALGELKTVQVQGLLKIYSASSDISLAEEAKLALAACGGLLYQRRTGLQAIRELQASVPAGAGFVGVWDLERTSKKEYLNFLTQILSKEMGAGNPFIKFIDSNKGKLLPVLQLGFNMTGNIRLDGLAAFLSANIGSREGYLGLVIKGKFDSRRLYSLMSKAGLREQKYRGVKILNEGELSMAFVGDNTFIWTVENRDAVSIQKFIDAALDKESVPSKSLKPAFDLVLQKKSRLAISDHFGESIIGLIKNELVRNIERLRGRNRAPDIVEMNVLSLLVNWSQSKESVAWLDDQLNVHVKCEGLNEDVAEDIAANLEALDSSVRKLVSDEVMKNISRGRNSVMMLMLLKNFDLDKTFGKIKQQGNRVSVIVSVKQILNIFPMAVVFL